MSNVRTSDSMTKEEIKRRHAQSMIMKGRPPVPIYSSKQIAEMEKNQGQFRCKIAHMKNLEGHSLKVSAHDLDKIGELKAKGYSFVDGSQNTAGEKIELDPKRIEREKFEKKVNNMNKKELIELAKGMDIKPSGTVDDLKKSILEFGQEKKEEDKGE